MMNTNENKDKHMSELHGYDDNFILRLTTEAILT
jgi:hypothetical protein